MKHYLIDSENVGDFWIPLLDLPADGVRQIGSHAFAQTKLESMLLPAALARFVGGG